MKGMSYKFSGSSVQLSFQKKSHQNLGISASAATSTSLNTSSVLLSMTVGAHVYIGTEGPATTADMVLPAGVWPLVINAGQKISVIKLTGSEDGQASVVIPED